MSVAVLSLIALIIAIVISCISPKNIGILAIGLSFIVGGIIGNVKVSQIIGGFPLSLFLMLAGVTYLFGIAQVNGTIEKITQYAVKAVRGNVALLPIVLFFVAFALSAIGPGHISIIALMAPAAMILAEKVGIPPLLMALMVGNGGQAGAVSPIAPTGVIANSLAAKLGYTGLEFPFFFNTFIGHLAVSVLAYVLFGGLKLWKQQKEGTASAIASILNVKVEPFNRQQSMTVAGIVVLIILALGFKLDVGLTAFTIGAILTLLNAADENQAIKSMPWGTIMMVCGVTVLVGLMKNVGGMDLFSGIIAQFSTPYTATLVVGFIAAIISAYASTSGVILPAFMPLVPDLIAKMGGGDPLALMYTILVAGHLVDVSPLSTTGALMIGAAGPKSDKSKLFRDMLLWGFAMSVVGAGLSWLFFTVLKF
ncbi:SLC13 family permease [Acetonema longum]|uniref:Dicarboxylate carrier MatC domain protein n=1 Tax=Acetonema longum DSM 6540 TaxID=1009370 RepID=F7NNI7_9FIRM|nr:SLC13 family permease [Acetonema longum]EGO62428.1 Dicarboxylate carrier MatC domain protein [Acetonema longum DSM 6540]